jgi:hypothetical protein
LGGVGKLVVFKVNEKSFTESGIVFEGREFKITDNVYRYLLNRKHLMPFKVKPRFDQSSVVTLVEIINDIRHIEFNMLFKIVYQSMGDVRPTDEDFESIFIKRYEIAARLYNKLKGD